MQIINWLAAFKPKQFARAGNASDVTAELCKLTLEEDPSGHDDAIDPPTARAFACHSLDSMALSLPSNHTLPVVLNFVSTCSADTRPAVRVAALAAGGCIVEGCADALRRGGGYRGLRDAALAALVDEEDDVRRAAAVCVLHLATHIQPEAADDCDIFLPPLLAALASPVQSERTRETVAGALDSCLMCLGAESVIPYLPQLMPPLLAMLETAQQGSHDTVLACAASAAAAAEEAFAPYATSLLPILQRYLSHTARGALNARAVATDCAGHVIKCLGKEAGKQLLPPFIVAAAQGFALGDPVLREYGHGLQSMAAELLEDDFVPYLATAVELAFSSLDVVCCIMVAHFPPSSSLHHLLTCVLCILPKKAAGNDR
jgi:hypothetical protein